MMKVIITVLVFIVVISYVARGQETSGLISTTKINGKTAFVQNDKLLDKDQVLLLMKNNPQAFSSMKRSNISKTMGHFFLGATVFSTLGFLGRPIYNSNYNHSETIKTKRILEIGVYVSAVLTLASYIGYSTNQKKAIQLYNSGLNQHAVKEIKVNIGMSTDGIGLRLMF